MSKFMFQKAVKHKEKLRLAHDGPAGGGKTWTALTIAQFLAEHEGGRVAVIDSERSSAKKYANHFDFDHLTLPDFSPYTYTEAIRSAVDAGYDVIVIDSLTHAWEGTLDLKDDVTKRSKTKDSFGAWREVTPVHNELVDVMLRAPAHVIATMRTKTEFVVEKDEKTGKNKIERIGLKAVQRDGVEYEFDVVGDLDLEHIMTISKSRCHDLADAVIRHPDERFAEVLWDWLNDGEEPPEPQLTVAEAKRRVATAYDGDKEAAKACWSAEFGDEPGPFPQSTIDELVARITGNTPPAPIEDEDPFADGGEPFDGPEDGDGLALAALDPLADAELAAEQMAAVEA